MKMRLELLAGKSRLGLIAAAMVLACSFSNFAGAEPLPSVPTTKIIAIGTVTPGSTQEAISKVLPQEVRETVQLHLDGKIEQWNVRNDKLGVVFVLNMTDVNEARAIFAKMPLDRAGLISFEFIPVGPLSPLSLLIKSPAQ
ncbi:hypothetical protein ACIQAL_03560 [Pseudomonas sp. NPDC088368]|uniref:hypothetical protein n=1 Tax=Pseudomonas sp. NPDC088368 TaxID=3364453 RepID=UPI00380FE5F5